MNVITRGATTGFVISTLWALNAKAATVDGYAFLEGQTDHSGIIVTLSGSLTVPTVGIGGVLFLLSVVGWLLITRNKRPAGLTLAGGSLFLLATLLNAAPLYTVFTNASGQYSFQDVNSGHYRLAFEKECFVSNHIDPVNVFSSPVVVEEIQLLDQNAYNESNIPFVLKQIPIAQWSYNNNSSPHTYTGDLACLVSGNGAGGVGFLDPDYTDGIVGGYEITMEAGDPYTMPWGDVVFWSWQASAIPLEYGCSGRLSFFIDEQTGCPGCMIQAGDLAGAHGDESLPYLCLGDKSRLSRLNMQAIVNAQEVYRNNSTPHTYTGELNCLVSGNGMGQVRLICRELDDGLFCNYTYQLTASEPVGGVSDSWFCTAWPVTYGGDSVMTFFVDDSGIVRGQDIGGGPGDVSLPDVGYEPDTCQ